MAAQERATVSPSRCICRSTRAAGIPAGKTARRPREEPSLRERPARPVAHRLRFVPDLATAAQAACSALASSSAAFSEASRASGP